MKLQPEMIPLDSIPTGDELLTKTEELAESYQRSYAYFRIIALWLYLDRPDLTDKYIQEMSEKYPDGVRGMNSFSQPMRWFLRMKWEQVFGVHVQKLYPYLIVNFPMLLRII